jgi:PIN domain nuclease of toxin-antitoxin system
VSLLLDTQAFLYWTSANPNLPQRSRDAIAQQGAVVFLSAASIWEIRIKVAIQKLTTSFTDVAAKAAQHRFQILSITGAHAQLAGDLPLHHRDPFDRMLIAQAMLEGLTLVSGDAVFPTYGIKLLWN